MSPIYMQIFNASSVHLFNLFSFSLFILKIRLLYVILFFNFAVSAVIGLYVVVVSNKKFQEPLRCRGNNKNLSYIVYYFVQLQFYYCTTVYVYVYVSVYVSVYVRCLKQKIIIRYQTETMHKTNGWIHKMQDCLKSDFTPFFSSDYKTDLSTLQDPTLTRI